MNCAFFSGFLSGFDLPRGKAQQQLCRPLLSLYHCHSLAIPEKSDRAIAVDLGINQSTVSRARKGKLMPLHQLDSTSASTARRGECRCCIRDGRRGGRANRSLVSPTQGSRGGAPSHWKTRQRSRLSQRGAIALGRSRMAGKRALLFL